MSGDLALQTIASLSGGQKSRVAFARMCMGNPNFLVLDEPTNHLDIETIEALGKGINKYTVSINYSYIIHYVKIVSYYILLVTKIYISCGAYIIICIESNLGQIFLYIFLFYY